MIKQNYQATAKIITILMLAALARVAWCQSRADLQQSISDSRRNAIVQAVENASPAVVNISTTRIEQVNINPLFDDFWSPFFDFGFEIPRRRELHGLGSGVILDRKGYVLTNQHVIENADITKVILSDGREFPAKIIGEDFLSDLAVLEIDAPNLTEIKLGDSENLFIGEWAIAIGHPFASAVGNPKPTVTIGVVSATNRTLKTENRLYQDLIQTDASINPGNSGGALVNMYGQLIGVNTAIYSTSGGSQGIGFAIPINSAKRIVNSLIAYGAVVPPYIGIEEQPLTTELSEKLGLNGGMGVLVASVEKGSPADIAGIRRGDVIEAIDRHPTRNTSAFRAITRLLEENQTVTVQLFREGKRRNMPLQIRELQWTYTSRTWGVTVEQLERKAAQKYTRRGILVSKIDRRSALAELGLKRGDLIYRIDNLRTFSVEDFRRITRQLQRGQRFTIFFERDGKGWELRNLVIQ